MGITAETTQVRVGVVLSAGGLRGAGHVGVLRRLIQQGVPITAIVGVSAGAVVAAYYAAAGLDLDELVGDAEAFRGRHLLIYSVNVHLNHRFEHRLARWCGVIPDRLRQLEAASFDRLHHGVERLGIACHDLNTGRACYFGTGMNAGPALYDIVRASASIPRLFPAIPVACEGRTYSLTDGGITDPVPIDFVRHPALGATHVIVSDCRWIGSVGASDANTVWIRPRMASTGTLWSPRRGLLPAVHSGEAAVTSAVLARIDRWFANVTRSSREYPGTRAALA